MPVIWQKTKKTVEKGVEDMQKRIEEYGVSIGEMKKGPRNKITDVAGVKVGHCTIDNQNNQTGVTVVIPAEGNLFAEKLPAASFVWNGFGKTAGLIQIDELGTLETPIALTNTLNVGLVHDALVEYAARQCEADGVEMRSLNPVVCECNDSRINQITHRAVKTEHVMQAFENACEDFEEGDVGCGKSTICHGLKGGVGSASRVFELGGKEYTIGVLVQSNHGKMEDLTVAGKPIGKDLAAKNLGDTPVDQGSIIMIVATDLPCSQRQLKRMIKRASVGLARLGSYVGHGSGEVMVGFSTARRIPHDTQQEILPCFELNENKIDLAFRAMAEATEEAVLNSMVCAGPAHRLDGMYIHSLREFL